MADPVDKHGYPSEIFFWEALGYNYKEVRAGRVTFFITEMAPGTYMARTTHRGTFVSMPAEAYAMYDLETWGRSAGTAIVIGE